MPHPKTLQAYKEAGVDYQIKGDKVELDRARKAASKDLQAHAEGKPNNVKRHINAMFRFRTLDDQEFILYEQDITAKANITDNVVSWHEDKEDTSMYFTPIVDRKVTYDPETEEPQYSAQQIRSTEVNYLIPFNAEEANKLKPFTNRGTYYYVTQERGLTRAVDRFDDWLKKPFDVLLAGSHSLLNQEWQQQQEAQEAEDQMEAQKQQQQTKVKVTKT